jgi:predicted dehydrogenase
MQNRYSPPSEWLKEIIETKKLVKYLWFKLIVIGIETIGIIKKEDGKELQDLDGGTLFTQFSHFIDIMYWLFGDIENIQGKFNDFTHKIQQILKTQELFLLIFKMEEWVV